MNPAETRFAAYLDAHAFSWAFEPDYKHALGLAQRLRTEPDFLIWRTETYAGARERPREGRATYRAAGISRLARRGGERSDSAKAIARLSWP